MIWPGILITNKIIHNFFRNIVYLRPCTVNFSLALRAWAANGTTKAQINNFPSESYVLHLFPYQHKTRKHYMYKKRKIIVRLFTSCDCTHIHVSLILQKSNINLTIT